MTASYAPAMRGGTSIGRGVQRAGSEGFQSDRPPSARTMPERSSVTGGSGVGNRSATNMTLAGGNRSSVNVNSSRFGNTGFSGRSTVGANSSSGGFGRSNSFAGSSFSSSGSRFSSSGFGHAGFQNAGFGHSWSGGYNHYGYGHYGYGRYGYGRGWGYGRSWGYGWGPGWGWGWGGGWGFLDDLFGLALNATTYALNPWSPFATLGADLIGDGVQALGNLDNNNDQGSYNNNYNYAPGPYDYQQQYPNDEQQYAPLCGSQYSDENPGCVQ